MAMNDSPLRPTYMGYTIYSFTEFVFNDATPLSTYKAMEKIKLSLVIHVC